MNALTWMFVLLSWNANLFLCDPRRSGPEGKSRAKRLTENSSGKSNAKWEVTWTDKLKSDLLLNYDKYARPGQIGVTTTVYADLTIRHIEMDEQRAIMTLHSWVHMHWNDEKLKWKAADYGGLKQLHLADHEVWQPDIFPYNGLIGMVDHFSNTNSIADENGTVVWVPPSVFQVFCDFDLTYWPFDTQVCTLKLGSWTYNTEEVDLQIPSQPVVAENAQHIIPNSEWKFIKMVRERHSTLYDCCPVPYADLTYNVTVQRQSPTYIALLVTPATAIIVMALSIFLIPPTCSDKITLGGTAIIITCLFLLYFTQKLPVMAGRTPLIVLFYSKTLYFLSFSVIISVVVINIAKNPKFSPLPWSIKSLLTGWLGKCLLINNFALQAATKSMRETSFKAEEMADSSPVLSEREKQRGECGNFEMHQQDWIMLAVAIDRIAFFLYCLIFIILAVSYSV